MPFKTSLFWIAGSFGYGPCRGQTDWSFISSGLTRVPLAFGASSPAEMSPWLTASLVMKVPAYLAFLSEPEVLCAKLETARSAVRCTWGLHPGPRDGQEWHMHVSGTCQHLLNPQSQCSTNFPLDEQTVFGSMRFWIAGEFLWQIFNIEQGGLLCNQVDIWAASSCFQLIWSQEMGSDFIQSRTYLERKFVDESILRFISKSNQNDF